MVLARVRQKRYRRDSRARECSGTTSREHHTRMVVIATVAMRPHSSRRPRLSANRSAIQTRSSVSRASAALGSQGLGLSRLSLPFLVGTLSTQDRNRAVVVGYILYTLGGWLFAMLYFLFFASVGRATWWLGALVGCLHGVLLLVGERCRCFHTRIRAWHPNMTARSIVGVAPSPSWMRRRWSGFDARGLGPDPAKEDAQRRFKPQQAKSWLVYGISCRPGKFAGPPRYEHRCSSV